MKNLKVYLVFGGVGLAGLWGALGLGACGSDDKEPTLCETAKKKVDECKLNIDLSQCGQQSKEGECAVRCLNKAPCLEIGDPNSNFTKCSAACATGTGDGG